jgi:hypothetical protein
LSQGYAGISVTLPTLLFVRVPYLDLPFQIVIFRNDRKAPLVILLYLRTLLTEEPIRVLLTNCGFIDVESSFFEVQGRDKQFVKL